MFILYMDDWDINGIQVNKCIHGTPPTLIGDTWGEMMWKGPIVAVLKKGNEWDPKQPKDMNLTAYRDAIDFLGYYVDGSGTMIDGMTAESPVSQSILSERIGKVKGVRINCLGDQGGDPARAFVQVDVPRTHPLFNLEGDDPLDIPEYLDMSWAVKSYGGKYASADIQDEAQKQLAENPLAQLLFLQVHHVRGFDGDKFGEVSQFRLKHGRGSVLVVDRARRDLDVSLVKAMCRMIEEVVVPLVENIRNNGIQYAEGSVLREITLDRFEEFVESVSE